MKKILTFFIFGATGLAAFCLSLSCSTNTPTAASNFQNPVKTIVAINPPFTSTFTLTVTETFTPTLTNTPTATPTPFVTVTWTGFNSPAAIAADGQGFIYVADTGNNRVGKFTSNGAPVVNWGTGGIKGKISVPNPVGLAVDGNGSLFVASNGNVLKYDSNGNNPSSVGAFTFTSPKGVAAQGTTIFVSDTGRLVAFTSSGSVVSSFGVAGSVTLSGLTLMGVAADSSDNVAVACSDNQVRVFNSAGVLTNTLPGLSDPTPGFSNPNGVAFDSAGNLWVADTGDKQVEEFGQGNFNQVPLVIFNNGNLMVSPKGIAVDSSANVYVVDSAANEVFKFLP